MRLRNVGCFEARLRLSGRAACRAVRVGGSASTSDTEPHSYTKLGKRLFGQRSTFKFCCKMGSDRDYREASAMARRAPARGLRARHEPGRADRGYPARLDRGHLAAKPLQTVKRTDRAGRKQRVLWMWMRNSLVRAKEMRHRRATGRHHRPRWWAWPCRTAPATPRRSHQCHRAGTCARRLTAPTPLRRNPGPGRPGWRFRRGWAVRR
jgi:hypothetical protein